MFLYLTIYIQGVLGYSPLEAGLRFLPLTLLSFLVAPISGNLSHRVPIRLLVGSGLTLVGVGLLLMRGVEPGSEWTTLLLGFLVAGAGIGLANPGIGQAAIAVVPQERAGMGSGINTTFRQIGIATGVAALGADLPVTDRVEAGADPAGGEGGAGGGGRLGRQRGGGAAGRRPRSGPASARRRPRPSPAPSTRSLLIAGLIVLVGAARRLRPRPRRRLRAAGKAAGVGDAGPGPSPAVARQAACCASCGSRTCC